MGLIVPPNQAHQGPNNRGSSAQPMGGPPQSGRGSMPTGDRFRLPSPPADAFPAFPLDPGKGMVPVNPFSQAGTPKSSASLPDDAGIPPRPPR